MIKNLQKQHGLTFLESLIAAAILSFGILGIAGLHIFGTRTTTEANYRILATTQADNLIESMVINQDGVTDGHYNNFDSDLVSCTIQPADYCLPTRAAPDSYPSDCSTPSERAALDGFISSCGYFTSATGAVGGIKNTLPSGRLTVNCSDAPCTPTSPYQITISWIEKRREGGSISTLQDGDFVDNVNSINVIFRPQTGD